MIGERSAAEHRLTIVERIAIAIAEEYPDEREAAPGIAEQLIAISEGEGIPVEHIAMWIRDRPRHELSAQDWRKWSKRYMVDAATNCVPVFDAELGREVFTPFGKPLVRVPGRISVIADEEEIADGHGQ